MSNAGFWTSTLVSPKRKFRFLVTIGNMPNGATWYAKSATKPAITVSATPHLFLNHTFHYPGKVEWNEITVVLVDPVSPDASANLSRIILESGYHPPSDVNDTSTISKSNAVAALGGVAIQQIDAEGVPVETWTLNNAFIKEVAYGGDLAYGEDALAEVTVKLQYDWASIETFYAAEAGVSTEGTNRYWVPGQSN
jgi:hypothetical protein